MFYYLGSGQSRREPFKKIVSLCPSAKFPALIISVGILLRLTEYPYNRSLWLEEAWLALEIVKRTITELLKGFGLAPFGFLAIEKALIFVFGNNEDALRLLPLLTGIASPFLFYHRARKSLRGMLR